METSVLMFLAAISLFTSWWGESQWWDEGWGPLEYNSASAGFTVNEKSWRQTVNRCWPCVQRKGCEITEHGPGPPRSRLCICQCACFHCMCVKTWRWTVRDRVRLKSFEIPAFLWGILSVIYLSWALWACTLNYRAELKDAYSQSRWEWLTRYTEIFFSFKEKLLSIIYLCSAFRFLYEVLSAHIFMFTFFFLKQQKNLKSQNERNSIKGICVNAQGSIPGTKSESYMWQLQYKQHFFCHLFLDFQTHCLK